MYWMYFPTVAGPQECPVKECRGRAAMWTEMRVHFLHIYYRDTEVILEEVNLPHPRCPRCDMLVLWKALYLWLNTTTQCTKEVERRRRRILAEDRR